MKYLVYVVGMKTKVCPVCEESKPLSEFNSQGKCCKKCHNARGREWRKNNPDKNVESQERYLLKTGRIRRVIGVVEDVKKKWKCVSCGENKPMACFAWKNVEKRLKSSVCSVCQKKASREHYLKNKAYYLAKSHRRAEAVKLETTKKILEYLSGHPCADCGEARVLRLSFDHRGDKDFNISEHYRVNASWEKVEKEIAKCDVRCFNCHMEKTRKEGRHLSWRILNGEI